MSLSPADQAFVDILDDKIDHCLSAAENIPNYGCDGGMMLAVRAIAEAKKPHHAFFRTAQQLEREGFDSAFWQDLVADYDACKQDLRKLEREEGPYFTIKKVNRVLGIIKDFRSVAETITFAFGHVRHIDSGQARIFEKAWKDFEDAIRALMKEHKKDLK